MAVYTLAVNGRSHKFDVDGRRTLLSVLRDEMGLTGTKYGCGEGVCGSCTVLLDGQAVRSCMVQLSAVGSRVVTTIEGLERDGKLHPVQEVFLELSAFQCGYCTPGMIMGAVALLRKMPKADEAQIKKALEGHVCRCGTYPRIIEAVRMAQR